LKIAIIGSGAMGMLFGGYLSKHNEVVLLDTDETKVAAINSNGIRIQEPDGNVTAAAPKAALRAERLGVVDLAILFVKAMDSRSALRANRSLIGPDTYVMSLQNGFGHDTVMKEFVAENRIVIGTTQHNSSIVEAGIIHHGGGGKTFIGPMGGDGHRLKPIEQAFARCGFETEISDNIRRKIWEKLFVNTSASALTAILQTNLGFILGNSHAWGLAKQLITEAVAVANQVGMGFEEEKVLDELRKLLKQARSGTTSIYADIRDGRRTEVDTISGAVVAAGKRTNVPTPVHEFVVGLIHAMEETKRMQLISCSRGDENERLSDGEFTNH
jgi:2-dehydropantoate 2-reductase